MTNKQITNFAIDLDEQTQKQFENCYNKKFVISASLMPDAHKGYVAPIGSVFITKDYIIPSWVGYDIGCGMIACKFKKKDILKQIKKYDFHIFDQVKSVIPMGQGNISKHNKITQETKIQFKELIKNLKEKEYNKEIFKLLNTQSLAHLGTLGSGNHFIELGFIDTQENQNKKEEQEINQDEVWVIIHSGSRGIGHKIATHYMKIAANKKDKFEETYPLKIDTREAKEYLNILEFTQEFALLNRLEMAYKVRDVLRETLNDKILDFELWINKNHNHAIEQNNNTFIHRKGATPAKKGEKGIIPANMKDGSYLVEGKGNKDYLESSSHGAGRKLSRAKARKTLNLENFKKDMKNIIAETNKDTIDESPQAYKDINEVMKAQEKSVKVIAHIKPLINWKG